MQRRSGKLSVGRMPEHQLQVQILPAHKSVSHNQTRSLTSNRQPDGAESPAKKMKKLFKPFRASLEAADFDRDEKMFNDLSSPREFPCRSRNPVCQPRRGL
jgi:hypothetical protein